MVPVESCPVLLIIDNKQRFIIAGELTSIVLEHQFAVVTDRLELGKLQIEYLQCPQSTTLKPQPR